MFGGEPFRMPPQGPAHAYQTFQIRTPKGPEFERAATCEEVNCDAWRHGWVTRVPIGNAEMIEAVMTSGRPFAEITGLDSAEREFLFNPGTPCFRASQHKMPVRPDLPQIFITRGGDWRGNPTGEHRIHQRPEDWVEDAQETTAAVVARIERG